MEKAEPEKVTIIPSGFSAGSEPSLSEAFTTLQRGLEYLVNRLTENAEEVLVDVPVLDLGEIRNLEQTGYRLEYGAGNTENSLSIRYELARDQHARLEARYEGCDIALLNQLRVEGLHVVSSRVLGFDSESKAVNLELVSKIPVQFRFDLNAKDDRIDLWLANYQGLGVRHYLLTPFQLTEKFFCDLEACVLRADSSLLDSLVMSERLVTYRQLKEDNPWQSEATGETLVVDNVVSFDRPLASRTRVMRLQLNGESYEFKPRTGEFSIGRGLEASLRVEALSVSRNHAYLVFKDGEFFLGDTSSNGSFVQQDGRPELFVHREMRKLSGQGVIALGSPVDESDGKLIYYSVE